MPIIGDFHYNGHVLLTKYPECARDLAKYRINPGNASIGKTGDSNFRTMIEVAVKYKKPVRIGVNWGSLDQTLLTQMMDENSALAEPKEAREVTMEAMVVSALESAAAAEKYGLRHDQIILSAKVSGVQDLIEVYRALAARCDYPLHLGLTEAGMGAKGVVASSAAMSGVSFSAGTAVPTPALFTSTSTRPNALMAALARAVQSSGLVTSARTARPRRPSASTSLRVCTRRSSRRAPSTTSAPAWARACANWTPSSSTRRSRSPRARRDGIYQVQGSSRVLSTVMHGRTGRRTQRVAGGDSWAASRAVRSVPVPGRAATASWRDGRGPRPTRSRSLT